MPVPGGATRGISFDSARRRNLFLRAGRLSESLSPNHAIAARGLQRHPLPALGRLTEEGDIDASGEHRAPARRRGSFAIQAGPEPAVEGGPARPARRGDAMGAAT